MRHGDVTNLSHGKWQTCEALRIHRGALRLVSAFAHVDVTSYMQTVRNDARADHTLGPEAVDHPAEYRAEQRDLRRFAGLRCPDKG